MVFSTIIFLLRFLPITLALYYLAPPKLKNTVLFLCSLVFYCWGEVRFFPVMLALILINYLCGLGLEKCAAKPAARTALLLAVRGGDTLVTLDDSLNQLASVAAGQAKSVSSTATAVYLLTASGVESYGYDGTHNWSRDYGAAPQAVINARETLVFISGTVEVLNAPHE